MLRALTLLTVIATSSTAFAQQRAWADGPMSATNHLCWQGLYDPIPEVVAYTYVGFNGPARVGEVYRMRVVVAGLGCSGMYVLPQVKLPHDTRFAIDAANPVVCYLGPFSGAQQLTDGSCPQFASTAGAVGAGYNAFVPTVQPYWPLPPGKMLVIEFPVVSSVPMSGIASTNDFLLGGATFLDASPGNPVPMYNVPPSNHVSGIPSSGAWQGVFVNVAPTTGGGGTPVTPDANTTNTRFSFTEPPVNAIRPQPDGTVEVDLVVRVANAYCFSDAAGANSQSILTELSRAEGVDDVQYISSQCFGQSFSDERPDGFICTTTFGNVRYGVQYLYQARPATAAPAYRVGPRCAASGSAPVASESRILQLDDPGAPVRYHVVTRIDGNGTVKLDPESSCSADGDCASAAFLPGATTTVTATATNGATFSRWIVDGAEQTTSSPYVFADLQADHDIVAVFNGGTPPSNGEPGGGDGNSDGNQSDNSDSSSDGGCNAANGSGLALVVAVAAMLTMRRWWRVN